MAGLGSNATRSSPSDQAFGQLNDANHQQHHLQQQNAAGKMNQQQQQLQMQQQQQLQQQQMLQQQQQNVYFTGADGSTNLLVNQSLNPFTGQQQQLQGQQQQQAIQSLQTGLAGQQLQTGNYASFPNNALSQIDQQQQQQMALQQQQQLQLQQQQQLGQPNNAMMVNENTVGGQLFQQNKQLTQINSTNPQSLQQQQQQPYGLVNATGTGGYVQQVAQVRKYPKFSVLIKLNFK